jgi:hypothetical protein
MAASENFKFTFQVRGYKSHTISTAKVFATSTYTVIAPSEHEARRLALRVSYANFLVVAELTLQKVKKTK